MNSTRLSLAKVPLIPPRGGVVKAVKNLSSSMVAAAAFAAQRIEEISLMGGAQAITSAASTTGISATVKTSTLIKAMAPGSSFVPSISTGLPVPSLWWCPGHLFGGLGSAPAPPPQEKLFLL